MLVMLLKLEMISLVEIGIAILVRGVTTSYKKTDSLTKKETIMNKITLCAILLSAVCSSCGSDGPKSRYIDDGRTSQDMLQDISNASQGDGWLYKYDTEVFYLDDGEWKSYGQVSVYKNLEDDRDRFWVAFGRMKFATEEADKGGYSYKVEYGGVWYYF